MKLLRNSKLWANFIILVSVACVVAVLVAIFGVRGDMFGFRTAVGILRHVVEVGVLVLIVSVLMFAFLSSTRKKMLAAFLIALVPVAGIYLSRPAPTPGAVAGQRPAPLNDVSTDTLNPPLYEAVAAIRPAKSNTLVYPGEKAAAIQAQRFPSIAPIHTDLAPELAFGAALEIVEQSGWELIFADVEVGKIEAVVSSLVFNFKDDVVIRVTPNEAGSIVDIRSHSRIGRGDMNANGNRVIGFIENFQNRISDK